MNFIEQLFGISPDAGSGLVEACLIAVPLGVLVLRALLKRSTNHHWGVQPARFMEPTNNAGVTDPKGAIEGRIIFTTDGDPAPGPLPHLLHISTIRGDNWVNPAYDTSSATWSSQVVGGSTYDGSDAEYAGLLAQSNRDPNSDNDNIKNAFSDGRRIGVPIRS